LMARWRSAASSRNNVPTAPRAQPDEVQRLLCLQLHDPRIAVGLPRLRRARRAGGSRRI
jgi:hypothetical protein